MFASPAQTLEKIFVQITSTNNCDLVMSMVIIAVVFIVKELNDTYKAKLPVPIPIEVIVVRETSCTMSLVLTCQNVKGQLRCTVTIKQVWQ